MNLSDFIKEVKEGQLAKATFNKEVWFVTMSHGFIRYCNFDRGLIREPIKLTPTNINALYEIRN